MSSVKTLHPAQTEGPNRFILISKQGVFPYDTIHVCLSSALGLLMRGEALQSHYCHKVGHLSHVSLHAQSRWVTAVIGIRDYSTLGWLSLLRCRISTFPPAVCRVSANAKVKKAPSTPPLPVRSTSTKVMVCQNFKDLSKLFVQIWSYAIFILHSISAVVCLGLLT